MKRPDCSIDGCKRPAKKRGWCIAHYRRWQRHGDPTSGGTFNGDPQKFLEKAIAYQGDECLLWPYDTARGYGWIRVGYARSHVAHRIVCEATYGPPPDPAMDAAHDCGVRTCVTPRHLRWATRAENLLDRHKHGTVNNGERNGNARLVAGQIREIRMRPYRSADELAAELHVSSKYIKEVRRGRGWLHIAAMAVIAALSFGRTSHAAVILDPLHGFCQGPCVEVTSGGNNVTTIINPPGFTGSNYGFWLSSGPLTTPDTRLYFATPDNSAAGPVVTNGTINGASVAGTATLLSSLGQWTSGDLDAFLGSNLAGGAQPNNPLSNFLPFTQQTDPSATGYNLFELDLGSIKLAGKDDTSLMNLSSTGLPTGSMIFAFTELPQGNGAWTATASSGVLYDNGGQGCSNCTPVPEPTSLALLGTGLLGLGWVLHRSRKSK